MSASNHSLSNRYGLILSIGCVIHCMLVPVFIASLPAWGLTWLISPFFHQSLAVLGVAIGIWALLPGWKIHRRSTVIIFAAGGLFIMNYSAFFGPECCQAAEHSEEASHVPDCCKDSCCVVTKPENNSEENVNTARILSFEPVISIWNWLLIHPTVIGAALLAWAHCLNGYCNRSCCQNPRQVINLPSDD